VVGAGLAGLNAAYQLRKRGYTATVYEARSRVGGRVLSVTGPAGAGLTLDLGGSFINSDHTDLLTLARELNVPLFDRLRYASRLDVPKTAYFVGGRSVDEAEVAAALRPLARQIEHDSDLLDADYEQYAPVFDRLSVAAYLDQHADKVSGRLVRVLIEAAIRSEYGVETTRSSALQLLASCRRWMARPSRWRATLTSGTPCRAEAGRSSPAWRRRWASRRGWGTAWSAWRRVARASG
jgi:monoamine oxidase